MSDDQHPPAPPSAAVTALLIVIGVILLLPGLCTVVVAVQFVPTENVVQSAARDPFFQMLLVLWLVCLAISLGGIFLLRHAVRRARRSGEIR
jgi:thiol:disulfide interchange protein